jgi:nickel-dependent lactate racemase
MLYFSRGSKQDSLTADALQQGFASALERLGPRQRVLAVPPDATRMHSFAGDLTRYAWQHYGDRLVDILPALGTHTAMTDEQIDHMFAGVPKRLFREHDWRQGIQTVGTVPGELLRTVSEGKVDYPWPAQVANLIADGGHDLILSLGQVVPHEVIGMANYNKNIFIGTGGSEGIHKSHFLGAVYGMERIMGRADTPVRQVLDYASDHFTDQLPIVYALTVVAPNADGELEVKGLFVGDDRECFERASELSLQVNFQMLEQPLEKVVVYLDPSEFKSTWLGNKSIYRTRMAIADGGELIVLGPGIKEFGEDDQIDHLIRKHGYLGTDAILHAVDQDDQLRNNLSAAAHLIHGSSEDRFRITYCPGELTREEIEGVNFQFAELGPMLERYNPEQLDDGITTLPDGETIFFISNPALGLWATRDRFKDQPPESNNR